MKKFILAAVIVIAAQQTVSAAVEKMIKVSNIQVMQGSINNDINSKYTTISTNPKNKYEGWHLDKDESLAGSDKVAIVFDNNGTPKDISDDVILKILKIN